MFNVLTTALFLATSPAHAYGYDSVISSVESMVWQNDINAMVRAEGLSVVNVTWEDTGRYKGSVWGPNISDMTIGVRDASGALHPMPVIRFDNFVDTTADIDSDAFWVRTGNEEGRRLRTVSVADILKDVRSYLHQPSSWAGSRRSLWASRDEHLLVSAQACFLPIPRYGEATFTPVLYNYQSYPGNPAVLTMVATREGTSIQVVENRGGYMSEVLYFNEDGERAPFTAVRQKEFVARGGDETSRHPTNSEDEGLNVVLLIQVPLKQKQVHHPYAGNGFFGDDLEMSAPSASAKMNSAERSNVDNAVIGHGDVEGPFDEFNHLAIERDPRFPVRVTVQFYKATSNGVATRADIRSIRRQIDRVYAEGDYVGSLVTSGPTWRPTEWVPPYPSQPIIPEVEDEARWAEPSWGWMKSH